MQRPYKHYIVCFLDWVLKREEKRTEVAGGIDFGLFCTDKAPKLLCITEEMKAKNKVLLEKIKTEIKK